MKHVAVLPRQQVGLRAETADGTLALIGPTGDRHVLNPTARALWELCDGQTTVEEMVWAVCQIFSVNQDRAALDVDRILADLVQLDLVEWVIALDLLENAE
jgi:coenzyme PQQ synthesis protein D (PqqD)